MLQKIRNLFKSKNESDNKSNYKEFHSLEHIQNVDTISKFHFPPNDRFQINKDKIQQPVNINKHFYLTQPF